MLFALLSMFIALALLVKASDFVVECAARIARLLGISELVVGLTIVAIGTSLPELASSIFASLHNSGDLVVGNVIGSNVANIGLVLAASLLIAPLAVKKEVVKRDALIMLFSMLALIVVFFSYYVSHIEGLFLFLLFIAYLNFLFRYARRYRKEYDFNGFLDYFIKAQYLQQLTEAGALFIRHFGHSVRIDKRVVKQFAILFVASLVVIISADFLIRSALALSKMLHINASFIGLTVIAIGTSLPELSVSISAARLGKGSIMLGNIIGSCITNSLLVVGLAAIANEFSIAHRMFKTALFAFLFVLFFTVLIFYKKSLTRVHGLILLFLYAMFLLQAYGG